MENAALLVNRIHQDAYSLGVGVLRYAMTQVEYMAPAVSEIFENGFYFAANYFGRPEEHRGIEVPLQRDARTDTLSR